MQPDYVTFTGLKISSADFVLTHGVTPSVCVATCVPEGVSLYPGALTFYSQGTPTVTFQDCMADDSSTAMITERRGQRTVIRLLDRRWRWRGKKISGMWNRRAGDGTCLADTKKTYRELIELLFAALGEANYDIELEYPDLDAPYVNWSNAAADLELAWIVERVGGIIILDLDDVIKVVQAGVGYAPALSGKERTSVVVSPQKSCPEFVKVQFAPTVYQAHLPLEAVGLDLDGQVKPINKLSYTPKHIGITTVDQIGWSANAIGLWSNTYVSSPGAMGTNGQSVAWQLANQTVYKWYRIKEDMNVALPGGLSVKKRSEILPLLNSLISLNSTLFFVENIALSDPPQDSSVVGLHAIKSGTSNITHIVDSDFKLDVERGIVMFPQCVYKLTGTTDDSNAVITGHAQADLNLLCAFHLRKASGELHSHVESVETKAPGGVGDKILFERDMFNWYAQHYYDGTTTIKSSRSGTELTAAHGKNMATAYSKQYASGTRSDVQLVGVVNIRPSGRVHQVRWIVHPGLGSETHYSLDGEPHVAAPSAASRRHSEAIENLMGGGYV